MKKVLSLLVFLAPVVAIAQKTSTPTATITSVELASVSTDEVKGTLNATFPDLSDDGNLLTFSSNSNEIAAGNFGGSFDLFLRNRSAGTTSQVNLDDSNAPSFGDTGEPQFNAISGDGTHVCYTTRDGIADDDVNGMVDLYVRNLNTNVNEWASVTPLTQSGNGGTNSCDLTSTGRKVVFASDATDLANGPTIQGGVTSIYFRELDSITTAVASRNSTGDPGDQNSTTSAVSANGTVIVFSSQATNLVSTDTNGANDLFLLDFDAGTTEKIADCPTVDGETRTCGVALSRSGRFVAFDSASSSIVQNDTNNSRDVFVLDRTTNTTIRVSVNTAGVEGNGLSGSLREFDTYGPAPLSISNDGRIVVFESAATNLVDNDTNDIPDIFMHDLVTGQTLRISESFLGVQSDGKSSLPRISGDGTTVAYVTEATNIVAEDTDTNTDIIVAEVDVPELLTPDTQITEPPTTIVNNRKVTIVMELFAMPILDPSDVVDVPVVAFNRANIKAEKLRVRYVVRVSGTDSNNRGERFRKVSKRNQVTFKKLKPGNYRTRYKAQIIRKGDRDNDDDDDDDDSVESDSGFSPSGGFSINR